jgi:hypothetical protein
VAGLQRQRQAAVAAAGAAALATMTASSAPARSKGVSQACTARNATGHELGVADSAPMPTRRCPPRGQRGGLGVRRRWLGGVLGEEGLPAERERTADQHPVAADRPVGADLEVAPAQLALDLLVALLDPVAQPIQPHHLGKVGLLGAAGGGAGQVGQQVSTAVPGSLAGSVVATTSRNRRSGPQPPRVASAAHQVSV